MNATHDREATEIRSVQARGWEIQHWSDNQVDLGNSKSSDAARLAYQSGHRAYLIGDVRTAFECFRVAIENDPGCTKAHRWLSRVALELGLGSEAKRSFEALVRLQGYSPVLGQQLEYATEVSRFGLEAASQFREGCEAQKNRQWNAASVALGRVVALAPRHQRAWARLGQVLLELKSYDAAVIACERALMLDPNDAGSRFRLRLASKRTVSRVAHQILPPADDLDPKSQVSIKRFVGEGR